MKKSTLIALFSFVSITFWAQTSQAQFPCGGMIGIGPFGIGVAIDCPPPVVVVRPRPVPPVVVVERTPCHLRHNSPCQRPPVRRYRRPAPAPLPPAAPAAVVDAPSTLRGPTLPPRFTLGLYLDSSSFEDGALTGMGFFARYRFGRSLAIEGSTSVLSSCTNCNEYAGRTDIRGGLAGLWYIGGQSSNGFNFFLKGGVLFNSINFYNDANDRSESYSQTALELGGGLEFKITRHLGVYLEAMGMFAEEADEIGKGHLGENIGRGIPAADGNGGALNFRAGATFHF